MVQMILSTSSPERNALISIGKVDMFRGFAESWLAWQTLRKTRQQEAMQEQSLSAARASAWAAWGATVAAFLSVIAAAFQGYVAWKGLK